MFKGALAADPTLSIVLTVARGLDSTGFEEEVGAGDRLKVVGAMPPKNERHLSYISTEDLQAQFSQTKAVPYDVVVNGQPGLHPLIWNTLANRYSQGRYQVSVPVMAHMMWTITRELMKQTPAFYLGELDLIGESMACWYGTSLWESEMLRLEWIKSVRQWLSPAAIDKLERMTVAMPNGIDFAGLIPVWVFRETRRGDGDRVGVFWGGRLTDQKRWIPTLEVLKTLQSSGLDVWATTMFPDDAPQVQTWRQSKVSLETNTRRHRMYDVMALSDVVPCFSKAEGYGSAWLEFLAAGMLVVFKRESWAELLLPDWYPFFVDRDEEMAPMCLALARSWPDGEAWTKWSPMIRDWVGAEHDSAVNAVTFGRLLTAEAQRGIDADEAIGRRGLGRLAIAAAEMLWATAPVPIPLAVLGEQMTVLGRGDREFGKPGDMISPMYLRRALQVNGWRDVGPADEVRMMAP